MGGKLGILIIEKFHFSTHALLGGITIFLLLFHPINSMLHERLYGRIETSYETESLYHILQVYTHI